jgi:DNA-directed RNA polymerase subunit RPC12/RpoP
MRFSDYKCNECGHVIEYAKEDDLANFPKEISCPECSKKMCRVFSKINFDVSQGKLGNAKDGYTTGCVAHPSQYGKFKGTKIT